MTDAQLYLAIGVPLLFNGLLIGIMWQHISTDIKELRGDMKIIIGKIYELDNRISKIEDKLKIT